MSNKFKKRVVWIYEYTISLHGVVKVKAESFNDIKIHELLEELGDVNSLVIENVDKRKI